VGQLFGHNNQRVLSPELLAERKRAAGSTAGAGGKMGQMMQQERQGGKNYVLTG
jgi:hypothetical protein